MKRFLNISLSILLVAALAFLLGYVYHRHINQPVKKVIIHIARASDKGFLDAGELTSVLEPITQKKTLIKNIRYDSIEEILLKNPWIMEADVFTNIEGDLMVNIREQEPVLRIFPSNSKGFYLDGKGNIIPLNDRYSPRVMVANGYIKFYPIKGHQNIYDTIYHDKTLPHLLNVTRQINRFPFLKSLIGEIYLNSKGELDIVPAYGSQVIHLGNDKALTRKLENLAVFYKKALPYESRLQYKSLNLKYNDQIICTKN